MPVVKRDGIDFYYEEEGDKAAPTVIFSNSLGANLRMWDRQVEALKSQFHIIRYDQRGHGRTTVPNNPFSFDDLSSDVIHLMDALEVSQANFVGLSMGGMTALGLGILHGSRFKSLTASNCVATFSDQARRVWKDRVTTVVSGGLAPILDATMERWFTKDFIDNNQAEVDRIRDMMSATEISGYIACCGALERLNYLPDLSSINVPTLLIGGRYDVGTPPVEMRKMKTLISGSRYEELSTAHVGNIEAYRDYNELLLAFFDSVNT